MQEIWRMLWFALKLGVGDVLSIPKELLGREWNIFETGGLTSR